MKNITIINSIDVSTRQKRKAATALAIALLERIRSAEENYLYRIPPNLQSGDAYVSAEECVDIIADVVSNLSDAYY